MLLERVKANQRLEQILLNFIDVLRINILMVDTEGSLVLAPKTSGYGWSLSSRYGTLSHLGTPKLLSKFEKEGDYLKAVDAFGFHSFAIPIGFIPNQAIGYLIVGPVILNKRHDLSQYNLMLEKLDVNIPDFHEVLNEIRIASFNSLKSILDLLFDLSQYALKLNTEEKSKLVESNTISLMRTLLDLAMALTEAESGSIMLFNKKTKELSIQVHKGQYSKNIEEVRIKLGEGIAGLVAKEKTPFVINETETNNRVHHLLKRPELKCAVVLPIMRADKEILGVMNISTQQDNSRLATHSQKMLESLTRITSDTIGNSF
jgi:putative methionine-R-sulfoxide reductase with GAF domain